MVNLVRSRASLRKTARSHFVVWLSRCISSCENSDASMVTVQRGVREGMPATFQTFRGEKMSNHSKAK